MIRGFCEVIQEITGLIDLLFGLEDLLLVPLYLLFESFELLLVFASLFFEFKGLILYVMEAGLNGSTTALLVADEILHSIVILHKLSIVSCLDSF